MNAAGFSAVGSVTSCGPPVVRLLRRENILLMPKVMLLRREKERPVLGVSSLRVEGNGRWECCIGGERDCLPDSGELERELGASKPQRFLG